MLVFQICHAYRSVSHPFPDIDIDTKSNCHFLVPLYTGKHVIVCLMHQKGSLLQFFLLCCLRSSVTQIQFVTSVPFFVHTQTCRSTESVFQKNQLELTGLLPGKPAADTNLSPQLWTQCIGYSWHPKI